MARWIGHFTSLPFEDIGSIYITVEIKIAGFRNASSIDVHLVQNDELILQQVGSEDNFLQLGLGIDVKPVGYTNPLKIDENGWAKNSSSRLMYGTSFPWSSNSRA